MTISSNSGVPQQPMPGTYGSSETPIGTPADTTTTASQETKIINEKDIAAIRSNSFKATGTIEYASLPTPVADALETQIDATFSKLGTMDAKMVMLDMGAILGLMAKFAQEMRETGRMDRAAQLESKVNNLLSAAEQIKTAGEDRYKSAMIAGAMKIFSGAVQIGLSAAAFGSAMKAANSTGADVAKFNAVSASLTGLSKGMESIIDGISTMATADINLDAAKADAQRAIFEAFSQRDESKINEANEVFSQAMEILRKVMETLQSQMEGAHNANSQIASKMI